jgi:Manganese containing catalase
MTPVEQKWQFVREGRQPDLLFDIATEELSHPQIIGSMVGAAERQAIVGRSGKVVPSDDVRDDLHQDYIRRGCRRATPAPFRRRWALEARGIKRVGFDTVCWKPAELTKLEGLILRLLTHESTDSFSGRASITEFAPAPPKLAPLIDIDIASKGRDALNVGAPVATFSLYCFVVRREIPGTRRHGSV